MADVGGLPLCRSLPVTFKRKEMKIKPSINLTGGCATLALQTLTDEKW